MTNSFDKIGVICGPTATGKTNLAIKLAKIFKGEIISADSRQVYRQMDIITGKDLPRGSKFNLIFEDKKRRVGYYLFEGIPVWLLDVVSPKQRFSAADFYELSLKVIEIILGKRKLPIIAGGTGFYIKTITDNIETLGIPPDWKLREKLSSYSAVTLLKILDNLDPERSRRMNESDKKNPRRLVRAIEISKNPKIKKESKKFDFYLAGLKASNSFLYEKIDQRVEERVSSGAEDEVKSLLKKGYHWSNSALGTTIGYKEWRGCFENKEKKGEVIKKWKFAEHEYARKQLTWFKKIANLSWYLISEEGWQESLEKDFKDWYS
ncbi:tRNA dimethylallyltransferase [Candidatus Microgenomates bacterium]|jgi:tRNA dimethylallyltransferase|nr:MAG: tRNA dimethylallyltransferase [Candidatus Microgenomates bacterium]